MVINFYMMNHNFLLGALFDLLKEDGQAFYFNGLRSVESAFIRVLLRIKASVLL